MKLILLLTTLSVLGCTTQPTPEQVNAYAAAAHTVVHGAVQDYKQVKQIH